MQERKRRDSVVCSKAVIETRHHFSSHLGRMCVIAHCTGTMGLSGGGGGGGDDTSGLYALVKGSPEALESLIAPASLPANYSNCYSRLAKKGLRVLALAYRPLSPDEASAHAAGELTREGAECNLTFAGLIAFECKVSSIYSSLIPPLST
jgi:magnesium-transporting ATPase (P-type)